MTSVVLDASALIAFLRNEPGADIVRDRLRGSSISAVNYSEVLKKTIELKGTADEARVRIDALPISIVPFDVEQAVGSAALYPLSKPHGLSFADRACLALGISCNVDVLTTEKDMTEVDVPVNVVRIRGEH
ncbi:MAG: type II toxin-antitoxin system VapC family toxin [Pirellulales bacterium]